MSLASDLIKRFEGLRLHAYPDPATGGKPWTIGYGCTGPGIGPDTVWTQEQADAALEHRLAALESVLFDSDGGLVQTQVMEGQRAAILSLVWNIGEAAFAKSTLLKLLNSDRIDAAANEFPKWDLAAGHVMPGLLKRRMAERAVFLGLDDSK